MIRAGAIVLLVASVTGCSRHADPLTLAPAGVEVERRVLSRSDPNISDDFGHTALHLAVYQADATLARAVLAAGAAVDARDTNDLTPLMIAAGTAACDVAEALLAAGADVNATTGPQKLQPIHLATFTGSPEMLAVLLRHGAGASARDTWGRTPMHLLPLQEWMRVAALSRRLADAGADLGAKDDRGFTALHLAAENDCVPLVALYAERSPALVTQRTDTEVNALDIALEHDALLAADALFAAGLRPGDPTRAPPLLEAARFDDRRRAERVLAFREHPVDAYDGRTASETARAAGSAGVLALLEAYGHR